MRLLRGSHQGYKLGEEVQGDYVMQGLIKLDKADVGSPLLPVGGCASASV